MMKAKLNILITAIIMLVPIMLLSQSTPLEKVYHKFQDKPGFEAKEISEETMSGMEEEGLEADDLKDMLEHFEALRILSWKEENQKGKDYGPSFRQKIDHALDKGDYIDAVSIIDGDEKVRIYFYKPDPGKLREVALLIQEDEEITLISITGEFEKTSLNEIIGLVQEKAQSMGCEHDEATSNEHGTN